MTLRFAQITNMNDVFAEIQAQYPGASTVAPPRVWRIQNFTFWGPSEAFLVAARPLHVFEVELKNTGHNQHDVYIIRNDRVATTRAGTIVEG